MFTAPGHRPGPDPLETTVSTSADSVVERPVPKRDRTHYLYIAVIVAMVLGIIVGFVNPEFGVKLKWLGTGFVSLIKMMITPVIFCTIVLGIGSVRKATQVGKVGGLALGYFLTMSTVALAIGLVVGLRPGGARRGELRTSMPSGVTRVTLVFIEFCVRPALARRFGVQPPPVCR